MTGFNTIDLVVTWREIEPKKKPSANPITKAEVYEKMKDILPMYREMEAVFHSSEIYV